MGKKVFVKTRADRWGSKVWQGVLREVMEESVVVEEDERAARIPLEEITSAHLMYDF